MSEIRRRGTAAVLDVETTGLSPVTEEVIELSMVLFSFDPETGQVFDVLDVYTGLREPSVPIGSGAYAVHGIGIRDVIGKALDRERVLAILDRAEFLIAHNARFDKPFVTRLFPEAGRKLWYCSMSKIDWYGKGFASRGLQHLLGQHKLTAGRAHRAEADTMATLRLLGHRGHDGPYLKELLVRCGYGPVGESAAGLHEEE